MKPMILMWLAYPKMPSSAAIGGTGGDNFRTSKCSANIKHEVKN